MRPYSLLFVFLFFASSLFAAGVDKTAMDPAISACSDFYAYAGGGWMKLHAIPPERSVWGRFEELEERNQTIVHELLKKAETTPQNHVEDLVGTYFESCMDESRLEALGLKPIEPLFHQIDSIHNRVDLQKEIARLHTINIHAAFQSDSKQDARNSNEVILEVWQAGIGLPEGDYYFQSEHKKILEAYEKHIEKMFELARQSGSSARIALNFEMQLARAWMPRVERRVPKNVYNRMTIEQIQRLTPSFDWKAYVKNIGLPHKTDINIGQVKFFESLGRQFHSASLEDWKVYLRWRVLDTLAQSLPKRFVEEDFAFNGKIMTGAEVMEKRWKKCSDDTEASLGEAVGQLFVREHFSPETRERALKMVDAIHSSLKQDLLTIDWMGSATKKEALSKLQGVQDKIGYPLTWKDYSSLKMKRGRYLNNRLEAEKFENKRDQNKIGRPVQHGEWVLPPQAVNAGYVASMNEVLFPAGILQPPFFDPAAPDAFNYGGMGAVIGHELTHGFDDQGRQYDALGNLREWWSGEDAALFQERASCLADQFGSYEVEPGLALTGKLVLGESIADLGGLRIAYAALHKANSDTPNTSDSEFTPDQLFFLGWAQMWIENRRPESARLQATTDPHPPPKFRVNGPLSNMPEFAAAFGCKAGDSMVRPPDKICRVW
jgi:putative endopeptidase